MESAAPYQQLSEHPIRRLAHQAALVGFGALIGATSVSLILTQQASPVSTRVAFLNDEVPPDSLAVCNDHVGVKFVVCSMDHSLVALGDKWSNFTLFQNTMTQFYSPQFNYLPMYGLESSTGYHGWFVNEMSQWTTAFPWVAFQQMMLLGKGPNASSTTYAVGTWEKHLGKLRPSGKRMTVRITDFYRASADGRIVTNWMLIDVLDLLRQQGITPLPLSPLLQGRVSPPQGDGTPAPIARFATETGARIAWQVVTAMLLAEWVDGSTELAHWHRTMTWYGPVPFGFATSGEDYTMHFLTPLHVAFSGRRLDIDVFTCEGDFCAAHGTFHGFQTGPWLGYRASGKELSMDFGMHWRVDTEARQILEGWAIFDLPRMFLGLGVDLLDDGGGGAFRAEQDSAAAAAGDKKGALGVPPADNNQCANRYAHPPAGSQTLDCPDFVIRSTDATWHPRDWDATSRAVDTYFSDDWQSVRAFGMMIRGREALRDFMKDWLGGFPDVFIHVADVSPIATTTFPPSLPVVR